MFEAGGLLAQLQKLECTDQIVVAYSGGLDSTVLLHALAGLRDQQQLPEFSAVHVNHGLSADAQAWQTHCEVQCERFGIPLVVEQVEVVVDTRGLEDAAREARYAALSKHLGAGSCLLTAQHLDDQAETVLLRLLRGSGVRGLGAMPETRSIGSARLVRPLLAWSRDELLEYAQQRGLQWIEDGSNRDLGLDRNYLRHRVMPLLGERWPRYAASFAHSAGLMRDANHALGEQARAELLRAGAKQGTLAVAWLLAQPESMRGEFLQEWARMLGLPAPGMRTIRQALVEVPNAGTDRNPAVQWGEPGARAQLRRYRGQLYLSALQPAHDAGLRIPWNVAPSTRLPDGSTLTAHRSLGKGIAESLVTSAVTEIRFRQGGERCRPAGRCGSHPLKKILQEHAIPPWERDRIPMIYADNQLIAAAGYFVCAGCVAGPGAWGWELSWEPVQLRHGD